MWAQTEDVFRNILIFLILVNKQRPNYLINIDIVILYELTVSGDRNIIDQTPPGGINGAVSGSRDGVGIICLSVMFV